MADDRVEMTSEWRHRFPRVTPETMTEAQRKAAASAVALTPSGSATPVDVILQSPPLAERLFALYRSVHVDNSLPHRLVELAILIGARFTSTQFEWQLHAPKTIEAGVSPETVDGLRLGRTPRGMREDEKIVYRFTTELLTTHRISNETFAAARQYFSPQQIVDLITTNGFYMSVSYLINAGGVAIPEGEELPLPPIAHFPAD